MKNKKNLMIITHDLAIGGLQQVIVNLCISINRELFEPMVLCLRELGEFTQEIEKLGIKVILFPKKEGTDYFPFFRIAKILKNEKIEIIHTHNTQPFIDGTLGALLSGVKTIVHTDHARNFPDKKRYMFLEWIASHFAYKVVGVSEHTSNNLVKFEKISPKKIITIMNGIDPEKYDTPINKGLKKKELNINENSFIIGLGVRLTEQKGITYLIKALPDVLKKYPDLILVIAGDGPLEEYHKNEAIKLGIQNNIKFIGPRTDMPDILKLFDLYVLPSVWEGLPMVLLEAMAAQCPILATNVGGNSMAITDKYNGSLVTSKSPEALTGEIIKLLSNPETRKKYAENGKKVFDEKFSAKVMTYKYEKLYLRN